jgi:hypothetical protein
MGKVRPEPRAATRRVTVQARPLSPERTARLFDDARLYPLRFALPDGIDFVPMTYDSYRQSTFLDRRIRPAAAEVHRAPLTQVEAAQAAAAPPGEVGLIFHSAYCCSTLLASAIAHLPRMLVLKEPVTLLQIAVGAAPRTRLPLVRALLARRNDASDRVVIKASSNCSVIGAELLLQAPGSRALFLYSGLEDFVLAVLKDPNRGARLRETLASPEAHEALGIWWPASEATPDIPTLDDARLAAWAWIGRLRAFARMRQVAGSDRVLLLDGTRVAAAPAQALPQALQALGIAAEPGDIDQMLGSDLWQRHAKTPSMVFDQRAREQDLAKLAAIHRPAVSSALDFARGLLDAGRDPTFEAPRTLCVGSAASRNRAAD